MGRGHPPKSQLRLVPHSEFLATPLRVEQQAKRNRTVAYNLKLHEY